MFCNRSKKKKIKLFICRKKWILFFADFWHSRHVGITESEIYINYSQNWYKKNNWQKKNIFDFCRTKFGQTRQYYFRNKNAIFGTKIKEFFFKLNLVAYWRKIDFLKKCTVRFGNGKGPFPGGTLTKLFGGVKMDFWTIQDFFGYIKLHYKCSSFKYLFFRYLIN